MRWDSPFVLAAAGTLAIHLIALTLGDALVVTNPPRPPQPAPRIELVEIDKPKASTGGDVQSTLRVSVHAAG
ncbi:MAG: hypothetical protein H7138_08205, partial [Myxococcales bacterium]|nr:hypothetical protein [Myxococcales bacterium]